MRKPRKKTDEDSPQPDSAAAPDAAPAASDRSDARGLPKPPGRNLKPEEFLAYWGSIPGEMLSRIMVYLYRVWPVINRDPSYIEKFPEPVTQERILELFGGGRYKLIMTDADRRGVEVCKSYLNLYEEHPAHPPVLVYAELDRNAKENQSYISWLVSKGFLHTDGTTATDAQSAPKPAAPAGMDPLTSMLLTELLKSNDRVATANSRRSDSDSGVASKSIDMMAAAYTKVLDTTGRVPDPLSIVKAVKDLMPAPQNNSDLAVMLKSQADLNMLLLTKILDKPAVDPNAQLQSTMQLIVSLKDAFGDGGGRGGKWYETLAPMVPAALDRVAGIVQGIAAIRRGGPPPQASQGVVAMPNGAAAHAPGPMLDPQQEQIVGMIVGFLPTVSAAMLSHYNREISGADFAQWVADGFGQDVVTQLQQHVTPDLLHIAIARDPELGQHLAMPRFRQFLLEFLHPEMAPQPAGEPGEPGGVYA